MSKLYKKCSLVYKPQNNNSDNLSKNTTPVLNGKPQQITIGSLVERQAFVYPKTKTSQ